MGKEKQKKTHPLKKVVMSVLRVRDGLQISMKLDYGLYRSIV